MRSEQEGQLDFIDGMRALAALYIVIHHALQSSSYLPRYLYFFGRGHDVVAIFIVISGFCLTIPLAKRDDWTLKHFYRRRARRILPPYYAAIIIGVLLAPFFKSHLPSVINVTGWSIATHLLLVHNWIKGEMFSIDGPMWSIAVECQIYLVFPLIVLGWRKLGRWPTLLIAFIASNGLFLVTHHGGCSNFLFLFAEGMLGCELAFSSERRWIGPGLVIAIAAYLFSLHGPVIATDMVLGLATALLMSYLTQNTRAAKAISVKTLTWIGTFSYSIYLLHGYVMMVATAVLLHFPKLSAGQWALAMVFLVSPLAVGASYLFHVIAERPFMSSQRRERERIDLQQIREVSTT